MPYQVKRPSETRLKNGKRSAPTPTRAGARRVNPALGPVMGSFFGMGPKAAKAKEAPAKDAKEGASKKK